MSDASTTTTTTTGAPDAGAAGDGGGGAGAGPKTFSQEEVDRIVSERLTRERSKLGDIKDLQRRAAEYDKLAEAQKSEVQKAADAAKAAAEQATRAERDSHWQARIVRAEVRAAAGGKLADPEDAVRLLDLSSFDLDDEGNLDTAKVAAAIDALLKAKPYLAAGTATRQRTPDFDAGARGTGSDENAALNGDPLLNSLKSKLGIP